MLPLFANPAGLWVLLGLPAILAIHFLQQRAKIARTSTWFLIEKLAPDSARGRTWERLRTSRQLWMQLAAVLLAAWVLAEPRWVRAESAQTVVLVLDDSVSMDAFRTDGIAAAEIEMSADAGLATHTTWVVLTTNPRLPPLYRGPERAAASAALANWLPELGEHDLGPTLRLAANLAGATGRTLLITDVRAKVPPGQRAVGVGRPIENVGFAGSSVNRDDDGGYTWRALVQNHATTAQRRSWWVETGASKSPEQALTLEPGALTEISAKLPGGADSVTVVLAPDDFGADDRLPLVRPVPKPLTVQVDGDDEAAQFFRRLAGAVEGVTVVSAGAPATLRLARLSDTEVKREARGGIYWPPADQRAQAPLTSDPVTPERDPLVASLNWQGWFGTGPYGYAPMAGDAALLWQGKYPLVFIREAAATPTTIPKPGAAAAGAWPARKLMLGFDWATSNASRLPSTVLLVRRFLEAQRDGQRAPYSMNFDCNALIPLPGVPDGGLLTLDWQAVTGGPPQTRSIAANERGELRAPGRAGSFILKRDGELVVRGAAQFADPRQGDFRNAEKFVIDLPGEKKSALERNTRPDPFATWWLLVIAGLGLGSWWTRRSGSAVAGESAGLERAGAA